MFDSKLLFLDRIENKIDLFCRMSEIELFIEAFRKTRKFTEIIPHLKSDERFRTALFCEIESNQYPFPEYSSWISIHYYNQYPEDLTVEWVEKSVNIILTTSNHSVQRNLVCVLAQTPISLTENASFLDRLLFFIMDPEALPALKLYSIKAVEFHFIPTYPELIRELKSIFELLVNNPKRSIQMMCRDFHKKHKHHAYYHS